MEEIDALKEMYKIITLNLMGLDDVKDKIKSKPFIKSVIDAKKIYQVYKVDISKNLNVYGEKATDVNVLVKMFNDLYTNMELLNGCDEKIAGMLIEGNRKSLEKLEKVLSSDLDKKVKKIGNELREIIFFQIRSWQSYIG